VATTALRLFGGDPLHVGDEAVTTAGQGLERIPRLAERFANAMDSVVQPVLELHVDRGRPDAVFQLLPGHDLTRVL
jgi:hypothetical protein